MNKTRLHLRDSGTTTLEGFELFWNRHSAELTGSAWYGAFGHPPGDSLCYCTALDWYR